MMHFHKFILLMLLVGCTNFDYNRSQNKNKPLELAMAMADSQIKRFPQPWLAEFEKQASWGYTQGLVSLSFERLSQQTTVNKYKEFEKAYADSLITSEGIIKHYKKEDYNIDNINSGKILFSLFAETKDQRYRKALETLKEQLNNHPRTTEGGFWHKNRYPNQMWLDGIYMGTPFLAQYGNVFHDKLAIDDAFNQILIIQKHTYDQKTGLNYHGWDESKQQKWSNSATGQSPNFWGRSMGWYCMGMVDALDFLPKENAKYDSVKLIFKIAINAMIKVQDSKTGLWYQVLDQPKRTGNYLESTVSCMMVYAILKGVRMGYLEKSYLEYATKGFSGITENFIKTNEDGTISLTQCCSVAGLGGNPYRDGSFEYYVNEPKRENDPKGVGPFIMAAIEMHIANSLQN